VLSDEAVRRPFDPDVVIQTDCMITSYQNVYYFADSFVDAKNKLRFIIRTVFRSLTLSLVHIESGSINQSIKIYFLSNRNITVYAVYASAQKAAREAYAH